MNSSIKNIVRTLALVMILFTIISIPCFSLNTYAANAQAAGGGIYIKRISYDPAKKTVSFVFKENVKYKKLSVKITNFKGKNYAVKVKSKKARKLTVKVNKLKYGYIYFYKISGIKKSTAKKYTTIRGLFREIEK